MLALSRHRNFDRRRLVTVQQSPLSLDPKKAILIPGHLPEKLDELLQKHYWLPQFELVHIDYVRESKPEYDNILIEESNDMIVEYLPPKYYNTVKE